MTFSNLLNIYIFVLSLLTSLSQERQTQQPQTENRLFPNQNEKTLYFSHMRRHRIVPPVIDTVSFTTSLNNNSKNLDAQHENTLRTLLGKTERCSVSSILEKTLFKNSTLYHSVEAVKNADVKFDSIIVLSGGLNDNGEPNKMTIARLDAVGSLISNTQYVLSTGGFSSLRAPRLDSKGIPIGEGRANGLYLMAHYHISPTQLIIEDLSKDSIGNAFFTRTIAELMNFRHVLIITNKFHTLRTRLAFEWIWTLPDHYHRTSPIHLSFLTAPNGIDSDELKLRENKEILSIRHLLCSTLSRIHSMKELTMFMYLTHEAYSLNKLQKDYTVMVPTELSLKY